MKKNSGKAKDCIRIMDMIDQPLHALPQAINALLKRSNELEVREAQDVFNELDAILRRCELALHDQNSAEVADSVVTSCCQLLQRAFAVCADFGFTAFANGGDELFSLVHRIFHQIVEMGTGSQETQIEVLQVVDNLCEGALTKERAGALFIQPLLNTLLDVVRSYRVHRCVATALINAVKCSQQNKNRLGNLVQLAQAMTQTSDFFLQLQCVELLFRVARQNKALLSGLTALPENVRHSIQHLPNDRNLLKNMIAIVDRWNSDRSPVFIIKFQVQRVDAGSTTLAAATTAYFSPKHFLFLLDSSSAENITVPYSMVRSVKLSKDTRISFKLLDVPPKLGSHIAIGSGKDGDDVVTLHGTPAMIAEFKRSSIHQWIVDVLRQRASPDAKFAGKPPYKRNRQLEFDESASPQVDGGLPAPSCDGIDVSAVRLSAMGSRLDPPPSSVKKKLRVESLPPQMPAMPTASSTQLPASIQSMSIHDPVMAAHPPQQVAASTESRQHTQQQRLAQIHLRSADDDADELISQLRSVIEEKIVHKRREAAQVLNGAVAVIQAQIDESRGAIAAERNEHFAPLRQRVDAIKDGQQKVHEKVASMVDALNAALGDVKRRTQTIRDQQSLLEIEFPQVISNLKADEEDSLTSLKLEVESAMRSMEVTINRRIAEGNPLKFVASFVGRKLEQDTIA